ncbi:IclR family transcriptional regulator [Acrocarpospora pleiomorpha]|uniref:IclR family transcriptional regulator n=1 Tax=Acrocarpospora pleiomorpha TaxID=90975 RepID=A0A5M3XA17_9ACTN|nr:IclR family transcriptional regulator [Acrocarpospora pleiomorpha]
MRDVTVGTKTVLGKATLILRSFAIGDQALPLAELVRRTELHKATVYRLCQELVALRLLSRDGSGYRVSGGLFELGMRASAERGLLELAIPFLQDLYERTHETVHLGVLDGAEVVYVSKINGHRQVRSPSRVGGRMPLHCTAIGKVLLAFGDPSLRQSVLSKPLERRTPHTIVAPGSLSKAVAAIRRTGVAFEREESALGITCVAAPLVGADGAVAAISLTGPTGRFRPERHVGALRATAVALSNAVRRGFPGHRDG